MNADLAVVLSPATAWAGALKSPSGGHWLSRSFLLLVVVGCSVSLMTAGRLTLRLALPAMLYCTFVPALQLLSLAAVWRRAVPFRRAAELFSIGNLPWLLLLLSYAAAWAFVPTNLMFSPLSRPWRIAATMLLFWSAYIDYWFFRVVLGRPPVRGFCDLALQRAICWVPGLTFFVGPVGWQIVRSTLGA